MPSHRGTEFWALWPASWAPVKFLQLVHLLEFEQTQSALRVQVLNSVPWLPICSNELWFGWDLR